MNEIKMRCFVCLSETLSFTEAARRLFLTQQAVSKHVAQLEETVGCALVIRSKQGVSLTPEGKRLYKLFADFLRDLDEFRRSVSENRRKVLRIGMMNWLSYGKSQANILAAMERQFPDMEISMEMHPPGVLNQLLRNGVLDVVLMQERFFVFRTGISKVELGRSGCVVFSAADCQEDWEALRHKPLIIDAFDFEQPAQAKARAEREALHYGLAPERFIFMPNRDSVYSAVEMGHGITTGTDIGQAVHNTGIRAIPIPVTEPLLCLWKEENQSAAIAAYVRCAKQEYKV